MSVANELVLEFLDLSLHIDEHNKICVDVSVKPTNSFTYVLPSTCYAKKNVNNVPKGIAWRLRRIFDTDEKFDIRSSEYQNYLIARDYKPTLVKRQFHAIKNISRREAWQVKPKVIKSNFNLITVYNPVVKNLEKILNDNLHYIQRFTIYILDYMRTWICLICIVKIWFDSAISWIRTYLVKTCLSNESILLYI